MASEQRTAAVLARPQRWDSPFDASHAQLDASKLLQIPEIAAIEADRFPPITATGGHSQQRLPVRTTPEW